MGWLAAKTNDGQKKPLTLAQIEESFLTIILKKSGKIWKPWNDLKILFQALTAKFRAISCFSTINEFLLWTKHLQKDKPIHCEDLNSTSKRSENRNFQN